MKVQVKELRPNPYRRIEKYPIDREKVEGLKTSIDRTSFWDNLVAREKNGEIQIAYGHHRLVALRELNIKTIDIPIRKFDDGLMIQIMANENLDTWRTSPAACTETVLVAKEYLDGELAKYESWDHVNKNINMLFDSNSQFQNCKKNGVGQTTILKFLGGNWKQWVIQDALDTIKSIERKEINKKVVDILPSNKHLDEFKSEVKKYKIPPNEQIGIAKNIKKKEAGQREVKGFVADYAKETHRIPKPVKEPKKIPDIDKFTESVTIKIDELVTELFKLVGSVQNIESNLIKERLKINLNVLSETIEEIRKEF